MGSVCQIPKILWCRLFFNLNAIIILVTFLPGNTTAGQVVLEWDINSEPEISGYIIHWGTASRNYSESVDVGNQNRYNLSGLNDGSTYYFSVTAYDWLGNESSYSNEAIATVIAVDSDKDGLTDSDEIDVYGTNPLNADSDFDGAYDGLEVFYASDPLDGQSIPYCAADFDQNGNVNTADLNSFMKRYGTSNCSTYCEEDFDNDRDVDGRDFSLFLKAFGKSGCP